MAPTTPAKVFGICIDGPLRDISVVFRERYANRFAEADTTVLAPVTTKKTIVGVDGSLSEDVVTYTPEHLPTQRDFSGEAARPVPELNGLDPFTLLEKFDFADQAEIDDFVQGEGFFIFSRAPKTEEGLRIWLNELYYGLRKAGYKVVFIASDIPKTRAATLFFVADLGANVDEVRFVSSLEEYWQNVDVLVTANRRVLDARPAGKQGVLRLAHYNNPGGEATTPVIDLALQEEKAAAIVKAQVEEREDFQIVELLRIPEEIIKANKTEKPLPTNKLEREVTRISAMKELLLYFPV